MAKISANGATKLAERARLEYGVKVVAVLCSDGRILTRLIHTDGTSDGYKVAVRIRNARQKGTTALLDIFHAYCDRRNYDPRVGLRDLSGVDVYQSGAHLESTRA